MHLHKTNLLYIMDTTAIKDLIAYLETVNLAEVTIKVADIEISVKKYASPVISTPLPAAINPIRIDTTTNIAAPAIAPVVASKPEIDSTKTVIIKSPMIGTFYRRPSPDKPLFVQVGDKIQKGQVVCMVEAMKLFNEIQAEISGTIVKVLIEDNAAVQYEQELFVIALD